MAFGIFGKKNGLLTLTTTSPNSFFLLVGEFPLLDIKKKGIDLNLPYLMGFVKKELATVL